MRFLKKDNSKIAFTRMELINQNLVIDLIGNQKLSYEQARSVLKERLPGVRGVSSWSVRRFCSKRSVSSRVSTEKVTEMVMEGSSKVISPFWSWCIWKNSCRFYNKNERLGRHPYYFTNFFSFRFLSTATLNCNFFFFLLIITT